MQDLTENKVTSKNATRLSILSVVLLILTLLSAGLFFRVISQGINIEFNLMALMPRDKTPSLAQEAADKILSKGGEKILLLLEGHNKSDLITAASQAKKTLSNSPLFETSNVDEQWQASADIFQQIKPYRFGLLSSNDKNLINSNPEQLAQQAYKDIFGFSAGIGETASINEDPLGLYNHWIKQSFSSTGNLYSDEGLLWVNNNSDLLSVVIMANLNGKSFNLETQEKSSHLINSIKKELPNNVSLYRSGIIFHAAEAASRSKKEVTLVATGSTLGIILLFLWAFKSPTPLLASLLAIAFGSFCSFALVHSFFSQIHILTLVFGASLIGIAVDYSLHFLAAATQKNNYRTSAQLMLSILPEISLGLFSTVIAYSCLWQSSLPGLQQIASFSAIGLISSWLFVVVVFPRIFKLKQQAQPAFLIAGSNISHRLWNKIGRKKTASILIILFLSALGFTAYSFTFSSDVRALHTPSQELLAEEKHIQSVLQPFSANQYFLVRGASTEELLQNEEVFRESLDRLVSDGSISSYESVSRYWPSIKQQHLNYQLQKPLYQPSGVIEKFLKQLGSEPSTISSLLNDFSAANNQPIDAKIWSTLNDPRIEFLWLGNINNTPASLISLRGVTNTESLKEAVKPYQDISFVDQVERLSHNLNQQQQQALQLLLAAYIVVTLLLTLRYRIATALMIVGAPLLASLITLSLLGLLGLSISLFHVFGLFLILGLGMDYGIFLNSALKHHRACLMAIFLSAITSCLSFGLLSISSAPMISAFGLTVLLGSLLNLLLVPAVSLIAQQPNATKITTSGQS